MGCGRVHELVQTQASVRSYIEFPRNNEHSRIGNFDFKVLRKIHHTFNVYCRIRSLRATRTSGGDFSAAMRHDAIDTLYCLNKASILAGSTCLKSNTWNASISGWALTACLFGRGVDSLNTGHEGGLAEMLVDARLPDIRRAARNVA